MRSSFSFLPAIALGTSGACTWAAALMPQFYPIWFGSDPYGPIAAHPALWRINALLFLVGAVLGLAGCALAMPVGAHPLVVPVLLLMTVATILWAAALCLRLSVVPAVVSSLRTNRVLWLDLAGSWSLAMWYVAGAILIVVVAGIGAIILGSGIFPHWAGWTCVGSAALSLGIFVGTRDLPPVAVYLPLLPLALAAMLQHHATLVADRTDG